jgi:hypothetical protein
MRKFTILCILIFCVSAIDANSTITVRKTITWDDDPLIHNPTGNFETKIWSFDGAVYDGEYPSLPVFSDRHIVGSYGVASVELVSAQYESFDKDQSPDDQFLSGSLNFQATVFKDRGTYYLYYSFIPIVKTSSGRFERVTAFELKLHFTEQPQSVARNTYPYQSVLASGDIYKIAVSGPGIHKISYDFLKNELGIDIDNINPQNIGIYGDGGGMLPEAVDEPRLTDIEEIPIFVQGENDGVFNTGDFILFYAGGADKWRYNSTTKKFSRPKNVYSDKNFYFIKIKSESGLRLSQQESIASTQYTSTSFDAYRRFEKDLFNLLNEAPGAQGSGRDWYGDPFNTLRERSYSEFSFPNIITSDSASINVKFAARGRINSNFFVNVAGNMFSSGIDKVPSWTNSESLYAVVSTLNKSFYPTGSNITVNVSYPSVGDGTNNGWLDYIEINARCQLKMTGDQLSFRDQRTLEHAATKFQVADVSGSAVVWDITDRLHPKRQSFALSGSVLSFGANTQETLKEFVVFNPGGAFPGPEAIGKVQNSNYHGLDNVDMVIIYHPDFEAATNSIRAHRQSFNGFTVEKVRLDLLFNEFSSGRQDASAIRDFAKMLYDRNSEKFKYLLLMGDGSFDHRDISGQGKNFITVYETVNSLHPINSFPADDYFGLLTEGEGVNLVGALDIGVGRIPARTGFEADAVVKKIIDYETNPESMYEGRNRLTFIADDEDGSVHLKDSDSIAQKVRSANPVFNVNKIYFDAYQQESTPGGERFPKATEAINRDMYRGVLVMNYMGHGGATGWAQERVLTLSDINSWNAPYKLPLLVTATCSFAGFDEPSITSAGELALLKENGGVVSLFTTSRAVYISQNRQLTETVYDVIFQEPGSEVWTIGEILRVAKNTTSAGQQNSRKFMLLGDPAMKLAIPKYNVVTTKINDHDLSDGIIGDTIRALQKVTIHGLVKDYDGNTLTNFNGSVYPTIFDKEITVTTLGQNEDSPKRDFQIQRNIVFKGHASVVNGAFSFTFVVPKDINYDYGYGKISYYAEDGVATDARGYYDQIVIGGTYENAINDDLGPLVEVFMNSEDWVFGGTTDPSPTLLVKLADDNGINVVGNSIGHDLTGVLNENTQETYILNDFYESELDDHTKGTVRYPLFDLEEGVHTIKVKAWDVANNSGEGYTEFVVASSTELALDYVLNYPNPFTTSTSFQFEHNMKNQNLDIQVQIFTIGGRLVKTIEENVFTDGRRVSGIKWNGTDDYGGQLAKGVYLYKVKVRAEGNKTSESDFEKLVILK